MAAKSLWDQIEKWQQGFSTSIYYLDDFKTCCQDYTQKYASFTLAVAQFVDLSLKVVMHVRETRTSD